MEPTNSRLPSIMMISGCLKENGFRYTGIPIKYAAKNGTACYQIYQQTYMVQPGQAFLINSNVPHSCDSPSGSRTAYSSIIVQPDFYTGNSEAISSATVFGRFLGRPIFRACFFLGKRMKSFGCSGVSMSCSINILFVLN